MRDRLKLLIPPEEIEVIIKLIAEKIKADYRGKTPVLVGVLKGASVFLSDLMRKIDLPLEVDFIETCCYMGASPGREVCMLKDVTGELSGKDIIIVEGIVDRGTTVNAVKKHLGKKGPRSMRVCSLLVRERQRRVRVDYAGKRIKRGLFVVGYGLDYNERHRELPAIYALEDER